MADLKDGSTSYPTSKDTATLVSAETSSPDHINGATQAIVAIENEIGIGLKGTQADLVTRLAKNIHDDGGVLRGTSFPVSPPNLPHWFWRTDLSQLYIYNTGTANYQRVDSTNVHANLAGLTADDHTQYVHNTTARTISARHTFNPGSALPPFILHANAQNQLVTGLAADTAATATLAATATIATTANATTDGTNTIKTKIVNIGDWNMDTFNVVSVATGIAAANIMGVAAFIRHDGVGGYRSNLLTGDGTVAGIQGYVHVNDLGAVILQRVDTGVFDSTDYDATSFNRGHVIVTYIE